MRVLVAGATGVLGRQLLPLLAAVGHEVTGPARSAAEQSGATMVAVDALDRAAVGQAVRDAKPDAVINMLTAIPAEINPKRLAREFELTNRLRTDGTRNLLEAGLVSAAGQGRNSRYRVRPAVRRLPGDLANPDEIDRSALRRLRSQVAGWISRNPSWTCSGRIASGR